MKSSARARPSAFENLQAPDATTVLSIYLFLLLVIPSDRGIAALGSAGSVASLFALVMLLWWVWHNVRQLRPNEFRRIQPVRIMMFVFVGCVLVSYVLGALHTLPFIDGNSANMNLINIASFAGVLLVTSDGITDRERFLVLLRRISFYGGCYAALGLAQFFTGLNIVDSISIPGLSSGGTGGVDTRGGFVRPESTARHALEYAAVLSMILPIALTLAIRETKRGLISRWFPVAAIFMAAFLSVTRSALLGIIAVLVILVPTWEKKVRRMAIWAGLAGAGVLYVLVPGLSGTIIGMFSGSDPSVDSRTDSFSAVGGYVAESPFFGRGLGTMSPEYRIFDNQYIGLLIEIGVVGLLAFLGLIGTAMLTTFMRRRKPDPLIGALGPALCGAVLAGALLCAFFDAFHFPQSVGMLFLMLGLSGAHWNISQEVSPELADPANHGQSTNERTGIGRISGALKRRWYVIVLLLLLVVPASQLAMKVPGVYYTKFNIDFQAPAGATKENALRTEASSTVHYAALIQRIYEGQHPNAPILPTRAPLFGTGLRDAVAVYLPSAGGQWQTNFNSPTITVEIVKENPEAVLSVADSITHDISRLAEVPQAETGVWKKSQITTERSPAQPSVTYIAVRTKYALAVIGVLGLGIAISGAIIFDRLLRQIRRRKSKRVVEVAVAGSKK